MSTTDVLLITTMITGMLVLRFGVPMLVMWTVRQIGQHTLYRHT